MKDVDDLVVGVLDGTLVGAGLDVEQLIVRQTIEPIIRLEDRALSLDLDLDDLVELTGIVERCSGVMRWTFGAGFDHRTESRWLGRARRRPWRAARLLARLIIEADAPSARAPPTSPRAPKVRCPRPSAISSSLVAPSTRDKTNASAGRSARRERRCRRPGEDAGYMVSGHGFRPADVPPSVAFPSFFSQSANRTNALRQ